jgi:(E)-4-hydroxy-3-methylbut-2-enyl-diphosphate synthase
VRVGFEILKALGLRNRGVSIISCPTCARKNYDVIKTVEALEKRLAHITTPLSLSVIGCIVNGVGEAMHTDIGFTGGGKGTHQVYIAGVADHRFHGEGEAIVEHLAELVEKKVAEIEAKKAQ